jgi:hypothetical protein
MPQEHHGRPCFEVLVEGELLVADLERTAVPEAEYTFDVLESTVTEPGESAVIDPRKNEIPRCTAPSGAGPYTSPLRTTGRTGTWSKNQQMRLVSISAESSSSGTATTTRKEPGQSGPMDRRRTVSDGF